MTRSRRIRSLVVCAAVAAAGCGGGRPFGHRAHTQAPSRPWPLPVLARAEVPLAPESASRAAPSVDAEKIPAWSEVDRALGEVQTAPAGAYLLLSADDCARRAAETAPVVELLAYERAMADEVIARGHDSGGRVAAQARLLALQSDERRTRASADALARFYQLADAEARRAAAAKIVAEIDAMIAAADRIERVTGNDVPQRRDLAVRRAEALDELAALTAAIDRLDDALRTLLAIEPGDRRRVAPEVDTAVTARPVDVEAAVALAMDRRTELRTIRSVHDSLSVDTLGTARAVLAKADASLGTVAVPAEAVRSPAGKYEVGVRRMQLAAALGGEEARIAAEVRSAASEVETALRHVARAKKVRARRFETLRLLELEARLDGATRFTLGTATIDALRADAELLHQIFELRQAEVRLQAAAGTLLDGPVAPAAPPN